MTRSNRPKITSFGITTAEGKGSKLLLSVKIVEQLEADTLVHGTLGDKGAEMIVRLSGIHMLNGGQTLMGGKPCPC